MKRVTMHFSGAADNMVAFNLEDEQASEFRGILGRAWNERVGVMYTLVVGSRTHMINLSLVTGVDVE
jgi:hypothetical protein